MGVGQYYISGAYIVSDTAGIATFINSYCATTASGGNVFIIPAGGNTVYVGVKQI